MDQFIEAFQKMCAWFLNNPWVTLLGGVTLIQISPLKLDPWTWIGNTFRGFLMKGVDERLDSIKDDVEDIRETMITDKVESTRWNILGFANSCRQGKKHTKEEWDHCIQSIYWYVEYCEKNEIANGVIIECNKYLMDTYRNLLEKDDFL